MRLPIVYVRGYAGTQGEVEETVDDPFYGFSKGSTHIRVNAREEPQFFAFESPLVRLMKDYQYRDAYYGNAQQVPPPADNQLWPQTIWIYRYYDSTSTTFSTTFKWRGARLSIEAAARDLRSFIKELVLKKTGAQKVWLVAHSMGGLVARCMIQKIALEAHEKAADYVDKLFTYGTPHGGINFGIRGGGAIEWIRDRIGWNNSDDFGRQRMYEYLTPHAKAGDLPPEDFEERRIPPEAFPLDRIFCIVGTNSKDYDVAMGLSRKTVGPQSDGLVQISSAYVIGAHRAYIHRSHSGRYGMVNSEEGYQNLRRFLFGDIKVRAILTNALFPTKENVFYQASVRVAISSLPVPMHERTVAHYCPLLLSEPVILEEDAGQWVENRRQRKGVYHLFTTFLIPKEVDDGSVARRWALSISIYKLRCDRLGNLSLKKHLEDVPYWADALVIDVFPPTGEDDYRANYVWASSQSEPLEMDLVEIDGALVAEVAFPETAASKLGVQPIVRLETFQTEQSQRHGGSESGREELTGLDALLAKNIDELDLSVRSANSLKNANIHTLRDLVRRSEKNMLETKNVGKKSLNEIQTTLDKLGLSLGMQDQAEGEDSSETPVKGGT